MVLVALLRLTNGPEVLWPIDSRMRTQLEAVFNSVTCWSSPFCVGPACPGKSSHKQLLPLTLDAVFGVASTSG
jgi:hypothetical protein